jgi:serine/threonine protein kinase
MMDQIKRSRYTFDDPAWNNVSKDAKDFIANCLELDPEKRFTVTEAIKHRWFSSKWTLSTSKNLVICDHEKLRIRNIMEAALFKGRAINVSVWIQYRLFI